MKRLLSMLLCLCLLLSCAALAETDAPQATGHVIEIEKYGHALLDITIEAFDAAGFALGDIVTVSAGTYTGDMPYFNGYYVDRGEYMVRAYPGHTNIAVCINYGKFAETAGVNVGDPVTLTLKEKGGALTLQEINNLVYTTDRADYDSDEIFANFRPIVMGGIGEGRLYRSASPVNRTYGRADYANALAEAAQIKTVLNLANTEEEMAAYFSSEDFASDYYKGLYQAGQVIVLGLPINYTSDEFAQGIVSGMAFLAEHEPPYLVHCTEGKDRAGFASMLLEMLMGADLDAIVADYMESYVNYYHLEPGTDKYSMIAEKNILEMVRQVAGVEKGAALDGVDLRAAAEGYLAAHGMAEDAIRALQDHLRAN